MYVCELQAVPQDQFDIVIEPMPTPRLAAHIAVLDIFHVPHIWQCGTDNILSPQTPTGGTCCQHLRMRRRSWGGVSLATAGRSPLSATLMMICVHTGLHTLAKACITEAPYNPVPWQQRQAARAIFVVWTVAFGAVIPISCC